MGNLASRARQRRALKSWQRSALLILPADVVGQQDVTRGHDYCRNSKKRELEVRGRHGRGLTLAAGVRTSFRAIVFASQGCSVAFDTNLMDAGAAGRRLVENEVQIWRQRVFQCNLLDEKAG